MMTRHIIPLMSDIPNGVVEDIAESLNEGQRLAYSDAQIKEALWHFIVKEIEDLLEDLEARFMDSKRRDKLLGLPEIDRAEDARMAAGEFSRDMARDA